MRLIDADALLESYKNSQLGITKNYLPYQKEVINLITNAQTVQREGWVSVEDRLPDISDEYYLFGGYTYSKKWESNIKHWSTHENANKRMLKDNGYSHWQNLPAAPTDKE